MPTLTIPSEFAPTEMWKHLPPDWDSRTPGEFLQNCEANRAYAYDRWMGDFPELVDFERPRTPTIIDTGCAGDDHEHAGDCQSCYVEIFADGSAYIHSNGIDDTWNDLRDYLGEYNLRLTEGSDPEIVPAE